MKSKPHTDPLAFLRQLTPMQRATLGVVRRLRTCSRQEIGEFFGWTAPSVSKVIKPLLDTGLLEPEMLTSPVPGRPRSRLHMPTGRLHAIGVSLGFTSLTMGVVDLGGEIIGEPVTRPLMGLTPEGVIALIDAEARTLMDGGLEPAPVGIGVSFAGLTRGENDLTRAFPETATWQHVPFARIFATHSTMPLVVENDTFAGLLGELRYGRAVGVRDALYLYLDEGLNLGVLSNGRIHQGSSQMCGEFGHIKVLPNGPFCHCGDVGCLESVASSWAIIRELQQRIRQGVHAGGEGFARGEPITLELVSRAAGEGTQLARNLLARSGELIGGLLATVANVLDPEKVIVGGRYSCEGEHPLLIQSIREAFAGNLHYSRSVTIPIECTMHGAESKLVGAAALVFEQAIPAFPAQYRCKEVERHAPWMA